MLMVMLMVMLFELKSIHVKSYGAELHQWGSIVNSVEMFV